MIDVKNLHKSFGNHEVLKGVNEHIEKGEKVVVIGPSGSGKSTFLRCLNLLEEPTGGEIIFEGQNITAKDTDINLVRRRMGMVFQQFNLFPHLTVRENIKLAPVKLKVMNKGTGSSPITITKNQMVLTKSDGANVPSWVDFEVGEEVTLSIASNDSSWSDV